MDRIDMDYLMDYQRTPLPSEKQQKPTPRRPSLTLGKYQDHLRDPKIKLVGMKEGTLAILKAPTAQQVPSKEPWSSSSSECSETERNKQHKILLAIATLSSFDDEKELARNFPNTDPKVRDRRRREYHKGSEMVQCFDEQISAFKRQIEKADGLSDRVRQTERYNQWSQLIQSSGIRTLTATLKAEEELKRNFPSGIERAKRRKAAYDNIKKGPITELLNDISKIKPPHPNGLTNRVAAALELHRRYSKTPFGDLLDDILTIIQTTIEPWRPGSDLKRTAEEELGNSCHPEKKRYKRNRARRRVASPPPEIDDDLEMLSGASALKRETEYDRFNSAVGVKVPAVQFPNLSEKTQMTEKISSVSAFEHHTDKALEHRRGRCPAGVPPSQHDHPASGPPSERKDEKELELRSGKTFAGVQPLDHNRLAIVSAFERTGVQPLDHNHLAILAAFEQEVEEELEYRRSRPPAGVKHLQHDHPACVPPFDRKVEEEVEYRRGRSPAGVRPWKLEALDKRSRPRPRSRVRPRAIVKGKISEDLDLQLLSHVRGRGNLMEVCLNFGKLYASLSPGEGFSTYTPIKGFDSSESRHAAVSGWITKSLHDLNNINSRHARASYSPTNFILQFSRDLIVFFSPAMKLEQLEQFVSLMRDHNRFYIQNIAFDDQLWIQNEHGEFRIVRILQQFPNLKRIFLVSATPSTNFNVPGPMTDPKETIEFIPDAQLSACSFIERAWQVEDRLNMELNAQQLGHREKVTVDIVGIKRNGVLCESKYFGVGLEKQARKEFEEEEARINVAMVSEFCARRQIPGPEDPPTDDSDSYNNSDVEMSDV